MPDHDPKSGHHHAVNGSKWTNPNNVIRVLFWIIFLGVCSWGTWVAVMASDAKELGKKNEAKNGVQDVELKAQKDAICDKFNFVNETLQRIETRQMRQETRLEEISDRLPR